MFSVVELKSYDQIYQITSIMLIKIMRTIHEATLQNLQNDF